MKTTILLFTFLLVIRGFCMAQELVIEVTTDNNSEETSWILFDEADTQVASSSSMADLTTYKDTVQLSSEKCYYWTIYDSYGDGLNGGFTPGTYKLYLDGVLIASCADANFGDSLSVYSLGSNCASNDLKLMQIGLLDYISKDTTVLTAEVLNMGNEIITSVEATYSVDGFETEVQTIANLQLEIGQKQTISFPNSFYFGEPGVKQVSVNLQKVNGNADANISNNSLEKSVTVVDGFVQKNVIEDFASFECAYCPDADAAIEEATHDFKGTYSPIKYMCWDFADSKYYQELEPLQDYYFIMGLPSVLINGTYVNYTYFTPTYYLDYIGVATPVKITMNTYMQGDSIALIAKVYSNQNISGPFHLRGSVIENTCYDVSLKYSNNTPFYNISYHLINGFEGFTIDNLVAGQTQVFESKVSMVDFPFEEGSLNDMHVTLYLQASDKEILQSAECDLNYNKLPLVLQSNVADGASDVDTTGLVIKFDANRQLFNTNGTLISKIADHVVLRKDNGSGAVVPFQASINSSYNQIEVSPKYGWSANTSYYVQIGGFSTLDGEVFNKAEYLFTTRNYVGLTSDNTISIELYPNPANTYINIYLEEAMHISVYGINGMLIETQKLRDGKTTIDISNYENGYYYIQATGKNASQRVKFLKQ